MLRKSFNWKKTITVKQLTVIAPVICALFFTVVFASMDYRETGRLCFAVDLETSVTGLSQIFYDLGNGYNESDSSALTVRAGNLQKLTFPLSYSKSIRSIRFDPINVSASVRIKNARIENRHGEIVRNFPPGDFKPVQQIDKMAACDGILLIHTAENADDPIMFIENSSVNNSVGWREYLAKRGSAILTCGLLSLLFSTALICAARIASRNRRISGGLRKLSACASANPRKTIAVIGFVAAVASCYPVVFFGKSFVSPAGVAPLYPYPPYVPGFPTDVIAEDFRNSDVGDSAWSVVPNTVVQYNALIRHFEFPFWSRYVGCGVPLFGQGQSMIGDVLHWIPVSLGGSAVGWDMKFVLSKAVFAIGMGLLVFRLTRSLPAGLLIAFSSCFLGFFAFRFNHRAFFVLTYAPWIMLQWDRLGELLAGRHQRMGNCVMQALLLAAVAWLQLNAGAVKEGVITACFMHALGILFFIDRLRLGKGWIKSILIAAGFAFAVVLATSPHWLLFLDALGKSVTDYDTPGANVYQIWRLAGFFDNFYFQRIDGTLGAPSMNIFVLLCMTGAIVSLHWHKPVKHFGTAILFFLALSVAYGLVPRHILISIPLINNIQHIYNTFSVPMMILALVLAGFGIQQYSDASEKRKKVILAWSLSAFPILCIPYLSVIHGRMTILFSILVFIVIVTGIRQLYLQAGSGVWSKSVLIILACCFILLHIRHGMHLTTGVKEIDSYTQNPTARADFSNKSTAIEFVKNRISRGRSPVRVIAEGPVMFPGYNSMFGLEGIVLVEALRNRHFEKLLDMADYPVVNNWNWLRLIRGDQIESRSVALDLLNAGYVVAAPGTKMPKSMKLVHSSDLDVWERDSVWPRAFFVNQVLEVKKTADIPDAFAKIQTLPFAAVESDLIPLWMPRDIHSAPIVVPARRYTLTNNSTRFSVDASGPGIIVLSETYYPKDFIARLNGKTADYIRVNQAFKGIWVKEAGNYDVSFTYRPARLSLSILLSISGFFLLILLCGIIRSPV